MERIEGNGNLRVDAISSNLRFWAELQFCGITWLDITAKINNLQFKKQGFGYHAGGDVLSVKRRQSGKSVGGCERNRRHCPLYVGVRLSPPTITTSGKQQSQGSYSFYGNFDFIEDMSQLYSEDRNKMGIGADALVI